MWELYNLGTAFAQRPSSILGIEEEWTAYQFDVMCLLIGREIEQDVAKGGSVEGAVRRRGSGSKKSFRDARPYVSRKMQVPESGVW